MPERRRPLKLSILVGCCMFLAALCIILSYATYMAFSHSLYNVCQQRLDDIIGYVESHIDKDDLSECSRTGVESEKYKELMAFMDNICDNFGIHYLYICMPVYENDHYGMKNVLSADTTYNRQYNPDGLYLGYVTEDEYSEEEVKNFLSYVDNDDIIYVKNFSDWGYDYTAMKMLVDSKGNRFGFLCVDLDVEELNRWINTFMVMVLCITVILGVVFIAIFLMWVNTNVTDPISKLKDSVVSFAARSHNNKEISKLNYDDPTIKTHNEVQELSDAVSQMTEDIKSYIRNAVDAEDKVQDMKNQMNYMGSVVYQDALTQVKNKAWYEKTKERVDKEIKNGRARFAIVMVDLNQLKVVNDTYGHERGDEYIFGSCHQICGVYVHSSVCRIGGDEFVVLLENADYDNRAFLLDRIKMDFEKSSTDVTRNPWERYSAAVGMAVYVRSDDGSIDEVFRRADSQMYEDKQRQKAERR